MNSVTEKSFKKETVKKAKSKKNLPKDVTTSTESIDPQNNLNPNKKQAPVQKTTVVDETPAAKPAVDAKTTAAGAENAQITPSAPAADTTPTQVTAPATTPVTIDPLAAQPAAPVVPAVPAMSPAVAPASVVAPAAAPATSAIPTSTAAPAVAAAEVGGGIPWTYILGGVGAAGGLAALGGGGGSSTPAPVTPTYTLKGVVSDGLVKNAQIYVDLNDNKIADANENTGLKTDASGNFNGSTTLNTAGHALLAVGGTNIDTGLANTLVLKAPAGSTVINPLTTLLASGLTETQLLNTLGLPALPTGKTISTYDPLAALASNPTDATALAVQKAAAQVVVIATAGTATFADIATTLAGSTSFNLANSGNLDTITGVSTAAAGTIAATNLAIQGATTAPELTAAQLAAGLPSLLSDTGISSTDQITSNGLLTAIGNGMTVEYSTDGGQTWSSTFVAHEGINSVQIHQGTGASASNATTLTFTLDTLNPVAATISSGALTNDTTPVISGTAEAGATVTVVIAGATYTTTATGGVWSIDTATATPASGVLALNTAGTNSVSVTATDAAGNTSVAATQTLTIDVFAPTLLITSDVPAVNEGQTANITFTFSKEPVGFAVADVTTTGGSLTGLAVNALNPLVYTAIFTPTAGTAAGTASITVAGGYTDAAGNQGGAGTTPSISIDTLAPTLAITSDLASLTVGQTATITFTFSEVPVGFAMADVNVTGGTLGALSATADSKIFTAIFTPTAGVEFGAGSITVAGGYTDAALNLGGAGTTPAITYDTMMPTVTITSDLPALKIGQTALITFTFNEPPLGFTASDVVVTGGVLGGFTSTNDPLVYNAVYTPDAGVAAGTASITVDAGTYTGLNGNLGAAGTTPAISIDTLAPTLVITSDTTAVNAGQTANVTFTFSEAPIGFTSANVVTTGGSLSGLAVDTQNPLVYTAIFTPFAGAASGAASITVPSGYTDAAGNQGGSGSTPSISIDTLAPTLVITSDAAAVNAGQTATITFTFSEAPVGFAVADVATTGGNLTGLAVNALNPLVYTAIFTPTAGTASGTASITVAGGYTDAAGNQGGAGSTPSISIDTLAPVAPALTIVAGAANATQAEAIAGAVTVNAEVGSNVSVTFSNGGNSVIKTLTGTGADQTVALSAGDIATLGNGTINVSATTTDIAGNLSNAATPVSFVLDTAAPVAPVFALVAGADLATSTEAIAGAVTVTAENGSSVSVTFTSVSGSVTKTLIGNGQAQAIPLDAVAGDLATLGDGVITVSATTTDVAGNVSTASSASFVLDTTIGGLSAVHVGADSVINPAEVSATTLLTLVSVANVAGETVQSVSISGAALAGGTSNQSATKVNGNWFFDATSFAIGTLNVTTVTDDAAGNTITNTFTLENIAQSYVNSVTSTDGDNFINIHDTLPNGLTTTILVLPAGGDTINTVTISGTPSVLGGQSSVVASAGTTANTYSFNSNLFADGTLSVLVNVTTPPPAVTTLDAAPFLITKDTLAPNVPTVLVVAGAANATAAEATTTGAVTVNAEALSTIVVSFTNGSNIVTKALTGNGLAQAVTLTAADLITLGNGTITVNASTTDVAGNPSGAAIATSFVLDTVHPTLVISSDVSAVNAGQTALITFTFSEAPVGFTAANVVTTGGNLTGLVVDAQNPLVYTAVFTPTAGTAAGTASITVAGGYTDAAGNLGVAGSTPSISIDTLAPVAPALTVVTNAANATEAEALAGAVTVSAELGSAVSVIFSNGTASVTKTLTGTGTAQTVALLAGDITTLGNGTISVNATTTDVAGNLSVAAAPTSFILDTLAPTAPTFAVVAAAATATEAQAGAVTVSAEAGSTISVTFSNGANSVTKTLPGNNNTGAAQAVTLTAGDLFNLGDGIISVNATTTDAAGNVSGVASPASFVLDTSAPVAPAFVVSAATTHATATEALAGAVTVTAEAGSTVSVTFTDGVNSVIKTLNGNGQAQTVALAAGDLGGLTGLADGTISVSATATDVAGNTSPVGSASFVLDTLAPVAPTFVVSVATANATAAEAIAGAVTVTAELNSSVSVTFTNGGVNVIKTVTGTGIAQPVALTQADLTLLGNGTITVSATTTDVAGNVSAAAAPASFILDTLAPAAPSFAVVAAAATATEAQAGAVSVTAEAGSTVSVTFTGTAGNVTKTLTGNAAAQAVVLTQGDLTTLGNGTVSVSATATDVAGNTSVAATPASFVLDTVAPVAPTLAVIAGAANATAGEVISGAVTVTAELNSSVSVTFTNGLNSVTKALTGSGSPQTVALAGIDLATLGNGTITVSATATDVAGNVSSAGATSFILDTAAPLAPTLVVSAATAIATAAEAIAGAVTVNAEAGSTILLTFSGSLGSVIKTQPGAGSAQAVALTQAELDTLGNGTVTVSANTTDIAGNASQASNTTSFILDTVAPTAPVLVLAPNSAIATAAEATAGAVTVTAEFNSNISVVFTSVLGSVTKTLIGNTTAQSVVLSPADLATLGDGTINVSATTIGVAGNVSATSTTSFVLDTYIGGLSGVLVGADAVINPAEVLAATPLTLVPVANVVGESVSSVTISGAATAGGTATQTASLVNGSWFFDSTPFAVGALAVTTVTVDTAGNSVTGHFTLNNIAQPHVSSVTSLDGDTYVNIADAAAAFDTLVVLAAAGDTVNTVTISGTAVAGGQSSVVAVAGATANTYTFDANLFADGQLSVVVNVTTAGTTVNAAPFLMTKDTLAPNAPTFIVLGGAPVAAATAAEAFAGAVTVNAEALSTITVIFSNGANSVTKTLTGNGLDQAVTLTAADLLALGNGTITVNATATDAAHNVSPAAISTSFVLDTVAPVTPILSVVAGAANATAAEAIAGAVTVTAEAGSAVSVTFTGTLGSIVVPLVGDATAQVVALSQANLTALGDGAISVTATATDVAGNISVAAGGSFNLDTATPVAPTFALVAGADLATAAEAIAGAVTITAEAGATVSVTFTGTAGNITKTLVGTGVAQTVTLAAGEPALLGDGTVTVNATSTDAAGNASVAVPASFILDTAIPVAPIFAVVAGANLATAAEAIAGAVTVSAEAGSALSVTFSNGVNSVTKNLTGAVAAQAVALTQADISALGNGTISVNATSTDAAGNVSTVGNTSFILDTVAPVAPIFAVVAGAANATASEATAGAVTVNAEAGATVSVTFTGTLGNVTKTLIGSGAPQAVSLTAGDLVTLGDGNITVNATAIGVAGNASPAAASASFTLDTAAPVAPSLVVSATSANATAAEATSGAVTVTAESGSSVVVTFTNGANVVSKTLTGTGAAQPVALAAGDLTALGNGTITVSATATDVAGNSSVAATTTSFVLDTSAPLAPVFAVVAGADLATAAEALAGAVTVTAEVGSSISVTFSNGANSVTKTLIGTGAAQTVALAAGDLGGATGLADGTISVNATATDVAGNVSAAGSTSFILDTIAQAAPALVVSGTNANATAAEAIAGAVTVTADVGSTVTVTFTDGVNTVTKILGSTGAPQAVALTAGDLASLGNGTITVNAAAVGPAGNPSPVSTTSFILDTAAPAAPTFVVSVATANATAAEATAGAVTVTAELNSNVSITFTSVAGSVTKTLNNATGLAQAVALSAGDLITLGNGVITVNATTTDVAGNISATAVPASFILDTVAPVAPTVAVVAGADLANASEASAGAVTVTAGVGTSISVTFTDGVNSVTKILAATGAVQAVALAAADIALLANGTITVSATGTDVAGNVSQIATTNFILDTLAPVAPTLVVSAANANATAAEALAGAVTVTAEAGSTVFLTFASATGSVIKTLNGTGAAQAVALALGDLATLGNGTINVNATIADAAGNVGSANATTSFIFDTAAPNAPTLVVSATTANATAAEASAGAVTVIAEQGSSITVTFTGSAIGSVPVTKQLTGTGAAQAVTLTPAEVIALGDGTITVAASTIDVAGNVSVAATPTSFVLDTAAPVAPTFALVVGADFATAAEAIAGAVTVSAEAGSTVAVTFANGQNSVVKTLTGNAIAQPVVLTQADLNVLGNGAISVSATSTDVAGNVSTAATTGFVLDTVIAAPVLVVSAVTANATAAEATAGAVTVTAEAGATVTVTFTNGLNSVPVTVTGTGVAQVVALAPADLTTLGDGTITVSATATDVAGNISAAATLASFILDTLAPNAPTFVVSAATTNATAAEAIAGAVTVTAEAGSAVSVTFTNAANVSVTVPVTGTGVAQAVALTQGQLTTLGDGIITVDATTTDVAGNISTAATQTSFTLDTGAPAAPVLALVVGADLATATEATAGAVTVMAEIGSSIAVTFNGIAGSVTKTLVGNAAAQAVALTAGDFVTLGGDGTITVNATATDVAGNVSVASAPTSFVLDTFIGGVADALVGTDRFMNPTEVSASAVLTLVPVANVAGETVASVTISGAVPVAAGGAVITQPATLLNGNNWVFDATPFDTVPLTVTTIAQDTAGNSITNTFTITNSLQPTLNGVTSMDGDTFINLLDTQTLGQPSLTTIMVLPAGGDTINSVTISGTAVAGGTTSVVAAVGATANTYTFDSTLFADGQLSVVAIVTTPLGAVIPSGAFLLTKDTLVPNAPAVLVVPAAANATASEAINGAVTVNAEALSTITVSFSNGVNSVLKTLIGNGAAQAVTLTAADLITLGNGTITVNATTTDVAGNLSAAATTTSFVLDTAAPVAPALVVSATTANATAAEAIAGAVTVSAEVGSTISVTFTNGVNSVTKTLLNATGVAQAVTLLANDLTTLGNGTISVTATATDVAGNVSAAATPASFILDTIAPAAPTLAVVQGADLATAAEAIAGAVTVTAEAGASVSVVFANGANIVVKTLTATGAPQAVALAAGDVTALGNGTITVNATATDVAGNVSAPGSSSFIIDTVAPAAPTFAVVAGADFATATEALAGAVTVTAELNALVSVTFTNAANNTAVTKLLTGSGFAQAVLLAAGDLTTLGDGTITVSATATGAAGNVSLASAASSFILDTTAPVAPTLATVAVGTASAAEALAGAVTVTAEALSTITVTFTGVAASVIKTLTGTGAAQAVTLTAGDLTTLGQGAVTVSATTTDVAGNTSIAATPAVFTLDSLAPAAPLFAVVAGADFATGNEATLSGAVTVTAEAGASVSVVFSNGANSVTKTLIGTGAAQSVLLAVGDLATLGNGLITVNASATDVAGNVSVAATPASFTLDTLAPVAPVLAVSVATANATVAEALAGAVTVTAELGSTVTVTLTGVNGLGPVVKTPIIGTGVAQVVALTSADLLMLGGNGTITVSASTTDVAGNTSILATPASFVLDSIAPVAPSLVVSAATADATAAEALAGAVTVTAEALSTISVTFTNGANSVVKTLTGNGAAQAVALAAGDITTLGNGTITVTATTTDVAGNPSVAATPASFILDTLAPVAPTFVVSVATANATAAEAIAGAVTVTAEALSTVIVTFTNGVNIVTKTLPGITNTGVAQAVALLAGDLTTLGEGTITVSATATDVAGNLSVAATPASFILDTLAPVAPTFMVSATTANATAAEAIAGAVTVSAEVGSSIAVTFTNGLNFVTKTLTATGLAQAVGLLAADLTTLGDGTISVTATTTDVAGNISVAATPASFILDTLAPVAPTFVVSAATANATEIEAIAGAVTVTAEANSTVAVTFSNGVNSVTKTLTGSGAAQAVALLAADLTTLGNGTITVSAVATDVAGNLGVAGATSFILDTVAPVAPALVVSVATANATAAEAIAGAVTVSAELNSTISVTFTNGVNSVVKTLVGTGAAQAVALLAADLTTLGDGAISVSATATDVAGNVSVAATPASFVLDTLSPVAPTLVVSVATADATAAEAIAGAVTVTAENLSTISVTFTNGLINVTKTLVGNGAAQAVALTQADLNTLGNGTISISATATDVAGNVSVAATPASFILDTLAPVAPAFVVSVATANATAAEAIAGAVTVTAEALSTVTVTFTGALGGTVSKTLPGISNTGAAQAVALLAGDLATLGEGTITVTATTTDVAGNVSVAATPASFILDTLVPVAPTLAAAVTVVGIASAAEAIAGAVTVTAEAASTITVTFTGSVGAVTKTLTGTGLAQTVTLAAGDLALIGDGTVTVSATTTDVAGNISPAAVTTSFVMDSVLAAPVVTLNTDSGVSAIDNITNIGTVSVGAVEPGALVQYSANNGATWLNNFIAVEGLNNVAVRQTDVAGNFVTTLKSFTLDTQISGVSGVLVGTDAVILQAEALAQTPLTAVPVVGATGESVTAISITGTAVAGGALTQAATQVLGNWVFDSTLFADGVLTVTTHTLDIAGNTRADISNLTKNTVPTGTVTVTAGNDAFVNFAEAQGSTTLNVVVGATDTINSVTVTGFAANGTTPVSVVANGLGGGLYVFNSAQFGDGSLNVIVNMTSAGGVPFDNPKVLTKDTVIGGVTALDAGGDAIISVTESLPATVLNIVAPGVGETVSVVVVRDINGLSTNAVFANGSWTFDSTLLAIGPLSVQTTTVDAAGNSIDNFFTLDLQVIGVTTLNVGGDAIISASESSATTLLTLSAAVAPETLQSISITGTAKIGGAPLTQLATHQVNGTWTFDSTLFALGALTVTTTTVDLVGRALVNTFPLNIVMTGVTNLDVGGDAVVSSGEISAATVLSLSAAAAGETLQSISIAGTAAGVAGGPLTLAATLVGNVWGFDATQFANGALTVQTTTVDGAGRTVNNTFALTKSAMAVLGGATVGGDTFINNTESTSLTVLNVQPGAGDTVDSVTISGFNAVGGAALTIGPITATTNSVTFDATQFADGLLTVTAVVSGSSGVSVTSLPVTVTKDTLISGVLSVNVGGDNIISTAEDSTATVLTLSAIAVGETVSSITITGTPILGGAAITQNAVHQVNGDWVFDSTQFANGALTLQATTGDIAGNTITTPFTLTKSSPPVVTANVGGDAFINLGENTALATLNVVLPANTTLNTVTISGLSSVGGVGQISIGPIASVGNSVTFDATPFAQGTLTVTANVATVSGNFDAVPVSVTKDTLISGLATVKVGTDTAISPAEVSTATVLTMQAVGGAVGETVTGASITGAPVGGGANITLPASLVNGNWVFDATQFALGTLAVQTTTVDIAGNSVVNNFNVNMVGLTTVSSVTVGGNAIINAAETSTATILNVLAGPNDFINSVTVTDGTTTLLATHGIGSVYTFDATQFANGTLSVIVNVYGQSGGTVGAGVNAQPVLLTKDTVISGVSTALVGIDNSIDATEALASTVLTLTPAVGAVAETVASVTVTGTAVAGGPLTVNALGGGNNWTFNSTLFTDGNLSVNAVTNDTSGNTKTDNFTLTKNTAVAGAVTVKETSNPDPLLWDTYINLAEFNGGQITLNVTSGDTINGITISGLDINDGTTPISFNSLDPFNNTAVLFDMGGGQFLIDQRWFADGTLNVVANLTPAAGGVAFDAAPVALTIDTVFSGVTGVTVGGDALIGPAEISAATVITPITGVGETVQTMVISNGVVGAGLVQTAATKDQNGIWTFDATVFTAGQLTVTTTTVDAAGNFTADAAGNLIGETNFITLAANVIVGSVTSVGDTYISLAETSAASILTVTPLAGDFVNYVVDGTGAPISGVTITGTAAVGGQISIFATQDVGNDYSFDATLFADGVLSVTVAVYGASGGTAGIGNGFDAVAIDLIKDTQIAGVAGANVGTDAIILGGEAVAATVMTLTPRAGAVGETVQAVTIAGDVAGTPTTALATGAGNNWSFNAAQFTNGNLTVEVTTGDAAGNLRIDSLILTKSAAAVTVAAGITSVTAADTVYQDTLGTPTNNTFNVLANTNAAVLAGDGLDTVVLAASAASAMFARLDGGAGTADVLQLSALYSGIDLAAFNNAAQSVIKGFEVIDLATDAGANLLTLTASDLFNLGSSQVDVVTSAQMLTITGTASDTVNCIAGGFAQTGGLNAFGIDGNTGTGYSKYSTNYTDAGGINHQLELLIQNGVVVA